MSYSKPAILTDTPQGAPNLQQGVAALHDTLLLIHQHNKDPALQPLIADGISRSIMLRQQFDRLHVTHTGPETVVDPQVFQRLMALAGPSTSIELLDQLVLDLGAVRNALAKAAPALDWAVLRSQCHVLIAVAGSIGAVQVQANAEQLHRAASMADAPSTVIFAKGLLVRLETLLAYVQQELRARQAA